MGTPAPPNVPLQDKAVSALIAKVEKQLLLAREEAEKAEKAQVRCHNLE